MKGTKAMIELISKALLAGIKVEYVLFDTWFSSPAQLIDIKKLGLDAIAMIRKSPKIRYIYNGEKLNLNKIYGMNKKRRGRSKYLLSVKVDIEKDGVRYPAKIVCVRNKKNRKEWVSFICTNPELSEEEIIRIYGKRWQEGYMMMSFVKEMGNNPAAAPYVKESAAVKKSSMDPENENKSQSSFAAVLKRKTYHEMMDAIPDVPYGILAKDGIIDYNGVIFVCDPKTNSISLGDCSVRGNCISVQLEGGGYLNINRENIGQLAGCMDMFSAEDQERILRAIHQDQHLVRKHHEIDEIVNGIGEGTVK